MRSMHLKEKTFYLNSASGSKGCDGVTGLDIYEDNPSGERVDLVILNQKF